MALSAVIREPARIFGVHSGSDRLFEQGGRYALKTRDNVSGNDLANGGAGTDTCRTAPQDTRVICP